MMVGLINCESNNKADEKIIEIISVFLNVSVFNKDGKTNRFNQTKTDVI